MKFQITRFLSLIALIFSLLTPATITRAATLTVDSLADTVAVDGQCTLREAIQNANNNAATNTDCTAGSGADTINFAISGTITLGSTLPTINDPAGLTMDGAGQTVTISGGNAVRVLYAGNSLTLNSMTIANGYATGGLVGGGIYHCCSGTLTITNSTFSGNRVDWEGKGGAIYNYSGALAITNSTFSANSATHSGGGIFNSATLTITNSVFSGNSAGNGAWASGGGGIYTSGDGPLSITNSTFSDNSAAFSGGGGIYCYDCTLSIANSTFSGNSAGGGGAIYHIYNDRGTSSITNSTFSGNNANNGGGVFNGSGAELSIANSTFSSNSALNDRGGGVFSTNAISTITNSTFSGNSATHSGGAVGNYLGLVTLHNTIVANSISGGNCGGIITNGGSNLDDGTTCGWGSASGSMSNTNPLLDILTGSPAYFPLNPGSPAIDNGDDSICAAWPVNNQSQNGLTRPQGAHCDIGSYESVDTIPPTVQTITRADTNPTSAASVDFVVTFSEAVTGVDTSDFALVVTGITGASIPALGGGATTYTVTVNTGSDSGTIRLDVVDNDTIVDSALNPLGGAGAGNGNFTGGEMYSVRFYRTYVPLTFKD